MTPALRVRGFSKEEKEILDKTNTRISSNRGEIILAYREFYLGTENTGDFVPGPSHYNFYFESGIIYGNLVEKEGKAEVIQLSPISFTFGRETWAFFSRFFIPVKRKITNSSSSISLEQILKAKKGKISISTKELFYESNRESLYNMLKKPPYLNNFALLIGNDEIRDFLLKESKNPKGLTGPLFTKEKIEDFLYLMKHPEEVIKRVEKDNFNERKRLAKELVLSVNDLVRNRNSLLGIEERVLKLDYGKIMKQDGINSVITDPETYKAYINLKKKILSSIEELNSLLKEGDEINLKKHPEIRGDTIGFPSKIKPEEYLTYTKDIISSTQKIVSKLNEHIVKINSSN